jgi:hypothetical protein
VGVSVSEMDGRRLKFESAQPARGEPCLEVGKV